MSSDIKLCYECEQWKVDDEYKVKIIVHEIIREWYSAYHFNLRITHNGESILGKTYIQENLTRTKLKEEIDDLFKSSWLLADKHKSGDYIPRKDREN